MSGVMVVTVRALDTGTYDSQYYRVYMLHSKLEKIYSLKSDYKYTSF